MNLTELISEFKEATGRVDLSETEITKYLNRGCKLLDELSLKVDRPSLYFGFLDAGKNLFVINQEVRSIKDIWAYTSTKRFKLDFIPLNQMRDLYLELDSFPTGQPEYYTYSPVTLVNHNDSFQQSSLWAKWADFNSNDVTKQGLLVSSIVEEQTAIEIQGNFYTQKLSTTYPENYWSVAHEEIVIQAAIYSLDNNYRNTQGGKELLESITRTLTNLFHDDLETEYNRPAVMGG